VRSIVFIDPHIFRCGLFNAESNSENLEVFPSIFIEKGVLALKKLENIRLHNNVQIFFPDNDYYCEEALKRLKSICEEHKITCPVELPPPKCSLPSLLQAESKCDLGPYLLVSCWSSNFTDRINQAKVGGFTVLKIEESGEIFSDRMPLHQAVDFVGQEVQAYKIQEERKQAEQQKRSLMRNPSSLSFLRQNQNSFKHSPNSPFTRASTVMVQKSRCCIPHTFFYAVLGSSTSLNTCLLGQSTASVAAPVF